MDDIYKVASQAIIHELLDNEVIIANLDTGIYYSLREAGAPVWQCLVAGYNLNALVTVFSEKYNLNFQTISEALQSFINQLQQEGLLISISESVGQQSPVEIVWPDKFQAPILEKYEEMKDLLMLDPIHEVDEQGWPNKSKVLAS